MDWREEYNRRLCPAEDAMKLVKPGDLVFLPIVGPRVLPGALYRHCTEVAALSICGWARP